MFVFSKEQALLLLYLAHIGHFSHERALYAELDLDQEAVRQALAGLLDRKLIRRDQQGRLSMARDEPALLEEMAAMLRQIEAPTMLEYCLSRLSPQSGLEECEQVLRYLSGKKETARVLNFGISDDYVEHGNVDVLRKEVGLDCESITERIEKEYHTMMRENR